MSPNAFAAPKVSVMPSYTQLSIYANATVGQPITVWGRVFEGVAPYTYTLDFGDGSTVQSGTVTNPDEISANHTYTTGGLKTFTLTVTDANSDTVSRSGVVRAIISPSHEQKVNMAVEKAKLYLYRNRIKVVLSGNDMVQWYSAGRNDYSVGATSSTLLAFEQNGHLPGNDRVSDIYSDMVQKGLEWLTYGGLETTISTQTYGNPDGNGNAKGVIFSWDSHQTYANAYAGLALVAAEKTIAGAQARTVQAGPLAGRTYYSLIGDLVDQFAYCQSDQPTWGGWVYSMNTPDGAGGGFDGSSTQWIAFFLESARDLWGINPPAWVVDRMCKGYFSQRQNLTSGGIGYGASSSWVNAAKTGGALGAYKLGGYTLAADTAATNVARAVGFLGTYYVSPYQWGSSDAQGGVFGAWYCMYSLKRGMTLQGIDRLNTVIGERDWQTDIDLWLLGDAAQLPASVNPGERSINHMFGQQAAGSWSNSAETPGDIVGPHMNTAMGILMLTRSLPRPRPVAIIAAVGLQSNKPLARAFQMTGEDSYHLDPNASIVEYLWDFDDSNGLDWNNPGGSGVNVTNPGYVTVGTYVVTLRVKDNGDPAFYDTYTTEVVVVDTDVPPVAVAKPSGVYSGRVNQAITLDGSSSYDADGDAITLYSWDTNGDGTYGDAFGLNPTVTYAAEYVGQVGLRVTAAGVTSVNSSYADIIVSGTDLFVQSFVSSNINPNVQADLVVTIKSDDTSTNGYTGVQLKFYDGDPLNGGIQVGLPYTFDIVAGGTAVVSLPAFQVNGADNLTVWIDANQAVPEWDESNNFATASVSLLVDLAMTLNLVEETLVAGGATDGLFELTLTNSGPSVANNIVVDTSLTLPTGVTFIDVVPSATGTTYDEVDHKWTISSLAVDQSISLLIRLQADSTAPGVLDGIVCTYEGLVVDEPILDAGVNDPQTVRASVVNANQMVVTIVGPLNYNTQTNLGEGFIDVTTSSPSILPAVRVYITNLPSGVQVINASGYGVWNGVANTPYFLVNTATQSGDTQRIKVQYYRINRDYGFVPQYQSEILPSPAAAYAVTLGPEVAIEKLVMGNNDVRVAFPTVAGKSYAISYSSDLVNWVTVRQTINGVATITQFIDYGLPLTECHPSNCPQRFYKIYEITP